MALIVALVLASVMMVTSLYLFKSGREYRSQLYHAVRDLQAQYLAMGAMQHAELKVRYFPTELYDASEYSLGKNPYFDFTELTPTEYANLDPIRRAEFSSVAPHVHLAGPFNPGPRFISAGELHVDPAARWGSLKSLDPADADPANFMSYATSWFGVDGWPKEEDGRLVRNSDLYLWKYRSDLSNRNSIQPALALRRNTTVDWHHFDAPTHNDSPYEGMYEVTKLRVISIAGHRRLNEEAINFSVVATIWDPTTNQPYSHRLEKVLRVKRR